MWERRIIGVAMEGLVIAHERQQMLLESVQWTTGAEILRERNGMRYGETMDERDIYAIAARSSSILL
mgnify:CR=1 FL=1